MADIKFDCPRCKQSLEAPDDMAGQHVVCPTCTHRFTIPTPTTTRAHSAKPPTSGNKLHLIGAPTILVILLALTLPFLSVSCSNQKLVSSSGYKLLANISHDSATYSESFPTEHGNAWFVAAVAIVAVAGVMTTVSCILLAFRRNRNLLRISIALSVIGILATLALGYYFGVRAEGEIKANQSSAIEDSEGWEALGAAMAASLNISINMDAGYYLLIAALVLGLTGLLVPAILQKPLNTGRIVGGSITGSVLGLVLIYSISMCLNTLAKPARYSSPEEMSGMFDQPSSSPSRTTLPGPEGPAADPFSLEPSPTASRPTEYKATLPERFLDFTLGCSIDEAMRVVESGAQRVSRAGDTGNRAEQYTLMYYGNNSLADADNTMLMFWRGKLYMVIVVFSGDNDKCERLFQVLKHKVTQKYGKEKSIIAFSDKAEWSLRGLTVGLEREIGIMEDGKVYLAGIHDWLSSEVEKHKLQTEADGLGEL